MARAIVLRNSLEYRNTTSRLFSYINDNRSDGFLQMISDDDPRRLIRNLKLSIQTVSACGHAMRVTVADMLQDFDEIQRTADSNDDVKRLCKALERAIRDNTEQNQQVFELLGFNSR